MKAKYLNIFFIINLFLVSCSHNDKFNLVDNNLPSISYSVELSAPLVNIDSMAYTIVKKEGQMWFASFDKKGNLTYLNNVDNLFSELYELNNLKGIEYIEYNGLFLGFLRSNTIENPILEFFIDPITGSVIKIMNPHLEHDTNVISSQCLAIYPLNINNLEVFAYQQFRDSLNFYHHAILSFQFDGDTLIAQDTILLDSLDNIVPWPKFVLNNNLLYFYLVRQYLTENYIYEFKYDPEIDSISVKVLYNEFLPITYVPLQDNYIFSVVQIEPQKRYSVIYDLENSRYKFILEDDNLEDIVLTGVVKRNTSDYSIISFKYKPTDFINFAHYYEIYGEFRLINFNLDSLLLTLSLPMYTRLIKFQNYQPYGMIDNGTGFTIIGKADAFFYFPATLILKTDYRGKPINTR